MANTFRPYKIKTASGWDYNYFPAYKPYIAIKSEDNVEKESGKILFTTFSDTEQFTYSSSTRKFTCVIPGTYLLVFNGETKDRNVATQFTLRINDSDLVHVTAPYVAENYCSGIAVCIVTLAAGDSVQCATWTGSTSNNARYTTKNRFTAQRLA